MTDADNESGPNREQAGQSASSLGSTVDLELAARIVGFLNELVDADKPMVGTMLANRFQCNGIMADHPTVQVNFQHGGYFVTLLGLLNGLCGVHAGGMGPICAVWETGDDKESNVSDSRFVGFRLTNVDQ